MARCFDCGLLAFTDYETKLIKEAPPQDRDSGLTWIKVPPDQIHDRPAGPVCIVGARAFSKANGAALVKELKEEIPCDKSRHYIPGINPVETWRLQMNEQAAARSREIDDLRHRNTILVSAVITLVITLIGSVASAIASRYISPPGGGQVIHYSAK